MKPKTKISVIGAGSIGSMFGGLIQFHRPELEVVLIARGEHGRAMHDRGSLELRGRWGRHDVPITVSSDPADVIGSDLILFTVKTQDTQSTASQFADSFGDAAVVSLQNGINQHLLSEFVRADRLMVGMTSTNMTIVEPGVVACQRAGVSTIGPVSDDVPTGLVEQTRQTLAASRMPVEVSDSIQGVQYNKLLLNTMGYASVLSATDFLNEGIFNRDWRNEVAMPILSEGLRVLDAAQIPLQRVSGMNDIFRFQRFLQTLNLPGVQRAGRLLLRGPLKLPSIVYSVYQDLMRNRPTEIDFVNGEIVRLATTHGIDAPYNAEVVRVVHDLEEAAGHAFLTQGQVVQRFANVGSQISRSSHPCVGRPT